jgi:sodium/proline symporter
MSAPTIVIISFSLYTLLIVGIGLYAAVFARRSDEDFFLAGRSLGPWVAALSASASSESGWVTLGLVGIGFATGVKAYWVIPGCLLGYLFNWFVLAGPMNDRARALNALTLPDFFSFNFRERIPILRTLSVIVILAAMLAYVAGQLAAAGKAFEAAFDTLNYKHGVLIGAAIVLVYTVTGGFRAVCWTDFLQALLMVGTLVVFPAYLLFTSGGYDFVTAQLTNVAPKGGNPGDLLRFLPTAGPLVLIGFLLGSHALGINFGYSGMPHVLVRFMALKNRKNARIGGFVAFAWGFCVYWGAVTVGLFARAAAAQHAGAGPHWTDAIAADRELGLVVSAMQLLPGALSGLVLAAILAAICSTADSQLVVAASAGANDLYARVIKRSQSGAHPWINRLVVLALGIAAVYLVLDTRVTVYQYVLTYGWAMLGASFGPQVILILLWKRASYVGCVAGMAVGFAVTLLWHGLTKNHLGPTGSIEVYNLVVAFLAALVVNVILSLTCPNRRPLAAA